MERDPSVESGGRGAEDSRYGQTPALARGLAILEVLSGGDAEGMSLSHLSAAIDSPKNSTSRLLETLVAWSYVVRDPTTNRFRLTDKMLRIGRPRGEGASLVESSRAAMRHLRDVVGETVQLGIPIGDEGMTIDQCESRRTVRISTDIGYRFALHNNAPGKVLLAFRPPESRNAAVARLDLVRSTARTITRRADLRDECETVLRQGYATDRGEADDGIHCVAAPIRGPAGDLVATLWVSSFAGRLPPARFRDVAKHVIRAAVEIEGRLQQ